MLGVPPSPRMREWIQIAWASEPSPRLRSEKIQYGDISQCISRKQYGKLGCMTTKSIFFDFARDQVLFTESRHTEYFFGLYRRGAQRAGVA